MKIFNKIGKFFRIVKKSFLSGWYTLIGDGGESSLSTFDQLKAYRGYVYDCVTLIAERFATIDLYLWDNKKEEEVEDHISMQVLKNVNTGQTAYDLYESYAVYMNLCGKNYWYLPQAKLKAISDWREIYVLEPHLVQEVRDERGIITGYKYGQGSMVVEYNLDEILVNKKFNPLSRTEGYSPTRAIAEVIDTFDYALRFNRDFFLNNAVPGGIVKTVAPMEDEEKQQFKADWEGNHQGVGKNSRTAFLSGNASYEPISESHKDLQFNEGIKGLRDQVISTYKVPISLLGLVENTNRATMEVAEYCLMKYVVDPQMKKFVSWLTEKYLPLFCTDEELKKYEIKYRNPIPKDIEMMADVYSKALGNVAFMSINEAREKFELEPIEAKWADQIPQDPMVTYAGEEKEEKSKKKSKESNSLCYEYTKEVKEERIKNLRESQALLRKKSYQFFQDQKKRIVGKKKNVKKENRFDFDKDKEKKKTEKYFAPIFLTLMGSGWSWANKRLRESPIPFKISREAKRKLRKRVAVFASDISKKTASDIRKIVKNGIADGLSVDEIGKNLEGLFDETYANRAMTIATTETTKETNYGTWERFLKSKEAVAKKWVHLNISKVPRPNHLAMNGEIKKMDETFSNGSLFPGESGSPSEDINCHCDFDALNKIEYEQETGQTLE